jgi:uncharacterized membrane protein YeaQ/YmgE (transglycosylase-associated protein family)
MISRIMICIFVIALGLYGAWWASAAAHFFNVEKVKSYDELSTTMFVWFLVTAAVLCPILCWSFLKALNLIRIKGNA